MTPLLRPNRAMDEPSIRVTPIGYVHNSRSTPLLEFLPRGEVRQPEWSHELMRRYWRYADA